MDRYDKSTMQVGTDVYNRLLRKEIEVWSTYAKIGKAGEGTDYEKIKQSVPYLTYRKGTVDTELAYIREAGSEIDVLELGSADGWLTNEIIALDNVRTVTSIDIAVDENMTRNYNNKVRVVKGDLNLIEEISFDKQFDCIISHGTLHHLVDPRRTLIFAIEKLLKPGGILIINDTWVLQGLQLKTNAFIHVLCNQLPKSIMKFDLSGVAKIFCRTFPRILSSTKFADSLAHNHECSPFESISSASDYCDIYERIDLDTLHFKNFAALPALQTSWYSSPLFFKVIVQHFDDFLIKKHILVGDAHSCILRKK